MEKKVCMPLFIFLRHKLRFDWHQTVTCAQSSSPSNAYRGDVDSGEYIYERALLRKSRAHAFSGKHITYSTYRRRKKRCSQVDDDYIHIQGIRGPRTEKVRARDSYIYTRRCARSLYPLECLSARTNRIQSAVQTAAKRFEL